MVDFKNIPKEYRPIPFWSWNEKLDTEETARQCDMMHAAGIGGYFMHARGGLQTEYMGEEWFENIEVGIKKAEENGMDAWVYDENGWPSGFGSGVINGLGLKYQQKYIRMEKGERDTEHTICNCDGYHFYYEINPFYVDNMDAEVVKTFIDTIYAPYYERFGNRIKGIFTDEPQLSRNGIPWSFVIPEKYRERYGEEIFPYLRLLFENVGDYKAFRIKFYKLCTDLFCESYTKQIYDWCVSRGLEFTGHMVEEQSLRSQIPTNGAVMPHYRYFTMPAVDWLGRKLFEGLCARQLGSAAQQLGKKRALTESFAVCGHSVTFDDLRRIMDWQMVKGVTNMCPHLQGYSIRGIRKRDFPPAMYYQQPWWSEYPEFIEEMSRIGMIMAEGTAKCNVLLIHPVAAGWTRYNNAGNEGLNELDCEFVRVMTTLEQKHIEYHLGDETIMEQSGKVDGNKIVIGQQTYDKVIIIDDENLLDNTKAMLKEYAENGGVFTTADDILPSDIVDNVNVEYTKRSYDGFDIHYIVNSTDDHQKIKVSRGSKRVNLTNGELEDFSGECVLPPCSSILVYDDGKDAPVGKDDTEVLDISGEWKVVSFSENAITLDTCDVYFDGELVEANMNILTAQNVACDLEREVNIRCVFTQNMEYIPDNLQLVVECPEKYDILINGVKIDNTVRGEFLDISFKRIDVAKHFVLGENKIELVCDFVQSATVYENIRKSRVFESERNKLTYDMELEAIYLIGDFGVFATGEYEQLERNAVRTAAPFAIRESEKKISLTHIECQGFLFFAGSLTVSKKFIFDDTNKRLILSWRGANAVKVRVNGVDAGSVIWQYTDLDISSYLREGENEIELTVVNNLRNLLGPHHLEAGETLWVAPDSFHQRKCVWISGNLEPWNDGYCFIEFSVK